MSTQKKFNLISNNCFDLANNVRLLYGRSPLPEQANTPRKWHNDLVSSVLPQFCTPREDDIQELDLLCLRSLDGDSILATAVMYSNQMNAIYFNPGGFASLDNLVNCGRWIESVWVLKEDGR